MTWPFISRKRHEQALADSARNIAELQAQLAAAQAVINKLALERLTLATRAERAQEELRTLAGPIRDVAQRAMSVTIVGQGPDCYRRVVSVLSVHGEALPMFHGQSAALRYAVRDFVTGATALLRESERTAAEKGGAS